MAPQQLEERDVPELANICRELFEKYASPGPECSKFTPRNRAAQQQQRFSTIDWGIFKCGDTSLRHQTIRGLVIKQLVNLQTNLEFAGLHDIEFPGRPDFSNSFENTARRELIHKQNGTLSEAMEGVESALHRLDELRGAVQQGPYPGISMDTQDASRKSLSAGGASQAPGEVVNEINKEISLATTEKRSDRQQAHISPDISAPSQQVSPDETGIEIADDAVPDSSISTPSSMNSSLANHDPSGFDSILEDTMQPNSQPSHEDQVPSVETTSIRDDVIQLDALFLQEQARVIQAMFNDAKALFHRHMYQEAETEYDSILQSMFMEPDDASTILVKGNLANAIAKQGRNSEAEELYGEIWALSAKVHGEAHRHTLASRSNCASMLEKRGEYASAVTIYRQILQIRRTEGHSCLDILSSSNKLANALMRLGEFREARDIYTETLQSHIDELGEHHPNTIITLGNLVNSLQNQGKSRDAKDSYLSRMELGLRALDPEQPCWDWLRVRFEALRDYKDNS